MSHYITATHPEGTTELSWGTSGTTLSAIAATGFDLYGVYRAREHDRGWSGSGAKSSVEHAVAREAFQLALAWASALRIALADDPPPEPDPEITSQVSAADRAAADRLVPALLQNLRDDPPDEDTWTRSCDSIDMILRFSWEIYCGTRTGPAVMSFA